MDNLMTVLQFCFKDVLSGFVTMCIIGSFLQAGVSTVQAICHYHPEEDKHSETN